MRPAVIACLFVLAATGAGAADKPSSQASEPERHYRFARLEMPAAAYSDSLVALFDETPSLDKLEIRLRKDGIAHSVSAVCMTATDFPRQVRARLAMLKPGDNLLDRGPEFVLIMKIVGIYVSKAECISAIGRFSTRPEPKP